ncbi:hypothetical protein [Bowmanella dokdonensis]|uniref:Uncharacterized protein n=1 Tax=Bowmanella dokdonensis TaxID=751969 RepID=A0A939DSR5_9ALTE|nr:hypothetical protein [Bowmanella dokdonensis]MBN7827682.1 hypothetical protein [Bowmanella dokdonensis]
MAPVYWKSHQSHGVKSGEKVNVLSALIRYQDPDAETTGRVDKLTINEMRLMSQKIFLLFKKTYIEQKRNIIEEFDIHSNNDFLGRIDDKMKDVSFNKKDSIENQSEVSKSILVRRFMIKSFTIYQLSNTSEPKGSGIGCGYYDEDGKDDKKGIAGAMNDYIFNVCFNPTIDIKTLFIFSIIA